MQALKQIAQSDFARGTLLYLIGNNIASFLNFLYNIIMGRMLGPEVYGNLGVILAFFALEGTPLTILSLIIVKRVSEYWGKDDKSSVIALFHKLNPKLYILGGIISGLLILFTPLLMQFLKLDSYIPVIIIILYFLFTAPILANRAFLQGLLSFSALSLNNIVESVLKLGLSILLIYFGWGLTGSLVGPLVGLLAAYAISWKQIEKVVGNMKKTSKSVGWEISHSLLPVFISTIALTAFITVDVILVRMFYPAFTAGGYVSLTAITKIIYFGVAPIVAVMFPTISSRSSSGLPYILPLIGTLGLSSILALMMVAVCFIFPGTFMQLMFGKEYLNVAPLMGIFSIFSMLYTINAILTQFLLSISYYKPIYYLFGISLLQGIGIFLFHNSIEQIIWINILVSMIYFLSISYCIMRKESKEFVRAYHHIRR